ncbi:hypothetical protein HAX54_052623 [Datura stramonium]|uniref:Uncharacterized protein n=1 Tax=Datura stramonium TaxID=4076 RepID=A0ABS8WNP5_DATST|nr:hypothetical protein [Datura stramonium]
MEEFEVGDGDGELDLGDADLGDWVGAFSLLLLLGAAPGDDAGDIFGDDAGEIFGDEDGELLGDEDGELLGDVAADTNPANTTNRRATTITSRAIFLEIFFSFYVLREVDYSLRIAVFSLDD